MSSAHPSTLCSGNEASPAHLGFRGRARPRRARSGLSPRSLGVADGCFGAREAAISDPGIIPSPLLRLGVLAVESEELFFNVATVAFALRVSVQTARHRVLLLRREDEMVAPVQAEHG